MELGALLESERELGLTSNIITRTKHTTKEKLIFSDNATLEVAMYIVGLQLMGRSMPHMAAKSLYSD